MILRTEKPANLENATAIVLRNNHLDQRLARFKKPHRPTQFQNNNQRVNNSFTSQKQNFPNRQTNINRNYSPAINPNRANHSFNSFPNTSYQRPTNTTNNWPSQPININPRPVKTNFPTNQQVFGKPTQNVWAPKNSNKPNYTPTPMTTQTRLTQRPNVPQNTQHQTQGYRSFNTNNNYFKNNNQPRNFHSEELFNNEYSNFLTNEPQEDQYDNDYDYSDDIQDDYYDDHCENQHTDNYNNYSEDGNNSCENNSNFHQVTTNDQQT
ncbi:unnamed protein product [Brassicogethes aeneus]|uniref:Uncharacterized protein n=1 Tax=Brassicogethes aeneus TaxID=1431903 RepID=A0A9P0B2G6_BRAAE|nr:unnamed protein product [Brassicogethes aeneus]